MPAPAAAATAGDNFAGWADDGGGIAAGAAAGAGGHPAAVWTAHHGRRANAAAQWRWL